MRSHKVSLGTRWHSTLKPLNSEFELTEFESTDSPLPTGPGPSLRSPPLRSAVWPAHQEAPLLLSFLFPSWPLQGGFFFFFFLFLSQFLILGWGLHGDRPCTLSPVVSARPGPAHSEHLLRWWVKCGNQACVEGTWPLVWAHGSWPSCPTTSSSLPLSSAPDLPPGAMNDGEDGVALRVKGAWRHC